MANFKVRQIIQRFNGVSYGTITRADELCSDYRNIPVDTNYSQTVIAGSSDSSCDMRTMGIRPIENAVVVVEKIPSEFVVDVAIPIVINSITRVLKGVHPNIIDQIRVCYLNTLINHADDNTRTTRDASCPCLLCLRSKCIRRTTRANSSPYVVAVHTPQASICVHGIVAQGRWGNNVIGFGKCDPWIPFKLFQCGRNPHPLWQLDTL